MPAVLVNVAEAIRSELESITLSESPTLLRSYADWDDKLEDFTKLRLDVVPHMVRTEHFSRGKLSYICTVTVLVRKLFEASDRKATGRFDNASVDPLLLDLQTIIEFFAPSQPNQDGRKLTDVPDAAWQAESTIKAPYSRRMLKENNQFSGWTSLVYRVPRAFGS